MPYEDSWAQAELHDWTDPELPMAGGESVAAVRRRLGAVLDGLDPAVPTVLVSHGDAIRSAIAHLEGHSLTDAPWVDVPNGSVARWDGAARVARVRFSPGLVVQRQPGDPVADDRGDLERAGPRRGPLAHLRDVAEPRDDVAGDGLVGAVRRARSRSPRRSPRRGPRVDVGRRRRRHRSPVGRGRTRRGSRRRAPRRGPRASRCRRCRRTRRRRPRGARPPDASSRPWAAPAWCRAARGSVARRSATRCARSSASTPSRSRTCRKPEDVVEALPVTG